MTGAAALLPGLRPGREQRQGYVFHVIGWAAFVIDAGGVDWGSHTRQLTGHFVTFIATDLASGGTDRRRQPTSACT